MTTYICRVEIQHLKWWTDYLYRRLWQDLSFELQRKFFTLINVLLNLLLKFYSKYNICPCATFVMYEEEYRSKYIIIIIIIIMFMKGLACFLFLNPHDEVGPSISSSVVLCSFVLSVDIVVLVLVFYLCPSSIRFVATFLDIVLFPLLFSPLIHWFFSLSSFVIPSKCLKNFICAASKPSWKKVVNLWFWDFKAHKS